MRRDERNPNHIARASAGLRLAPITWIDTWLRLGALAVLVFVGLHNARPDALPGHDIIEQVMAYIDAARTALGSDLATLGVQSDTGRQG